MTGDKARAVFIDLASAGEQNLSSPGDGSADGYLGSLSLGVFLLSAHFWSWRCGQRELLNQTAALPWPQPGHRNPHWV